MSYISSRTTHTRRTRLLGIVVAAHVGLFFLILAIKTVTPTLMESPLMVDLLTDAATPKPPEAKPLPMAKSPSQPRLQSAQPQTAPPVPLEPTQSQAPSSSLAPVAAQTEGKPASIPTASADTPVSQARFDADYLKNPAPPYPLMAKRMGEQGKVILRVVVTPDGHAESVEVKTSSGSTRLDDAALRTVQSWRFVPAKRGDTPIQSQVLVPIIFKLEQ